MKNEVYDLALEAGLTTKAKIDEVLSYYERQTINPIRILLETGISETALYRTFASNSGLVFLESADVIMQMQSQMQGTWPISKDHMRYFSAFFLGQKDGKLQIASSRFDLRERICGGLSNLAGLPVQVFLVTPTLAADFEN